MSVKFSLDFQDKTNLLFMSKTPIANDQCLAMKLYRDSGKSCRRPTLLVSKGVEIEKGPDPLGDVSAVWPTTLV